MRVLALQLMGCNCMEPRLPGTAFSLTVRYKLMEVRRACRVFSIAAAICSAALLSAQVIEYEVNGLKYQTLSHDGLTVIVTLMPNHVAGFGLVQVSISNGSGMYWTVQPED